MIYIVLVFAHIYLTYLLLDACEKQHGKKFIKKHRFLLWVPIINYIFAVTLEITDWAKSYFKTFKTL